MCQLARTYCTPVPYLTLVSRVLGARFPAGARFALDHTVDVLADGSVFVRTGGGGRFGALMWLRDAVTQMHALLQLAASPHGSATRSVVEGVIAKTVQVRRGACYPRASDCGGASHRAASTRANLSHGRLCVCVGDRCCDLQYALNDPFANAFNAEPEYMPMFIQAAGASQLAGLARVREPRGSSTLTTLADHLQADTRQCATMRCRAVLTAHT